MFGSPHLRPTEGREEEKEERGDEGGEDEDDEDGEEKEEGDDDYVDDIGNLFDELSVSGLSAASPLKDLQAFIDQNGLKVSPGTGQHRTKVDIFNDISAVVQVQKLSVSNSVITADPLSQLSIVTIVPVMNLEEYCLDHCHVLKGVESRRRRRGGVILYLPEATSVIVTVVLQWCYSGVTLVLQ
jgi:predicted nucleic acid-binding Zn ribbon protein